MSMSERKKERKKDEETTVKIVSDPTT